MVADPQHAFMQGRCFETWWHLLHALEMPLVPLCSVTATFLQASVSALYSKSRPPGSTIIKSFMCGLGVLLVNKSGGGWQEGSWVKLDPVFIQQHALLESCSTPSELFH